MERFRMAQFCYHLAPLTRGVPTEWEPPSHLVLPSASRPPASCGRQPASSGISSLGPMPGCTVNGGWPAARLSVVTGTCLSRHNSRVGISLEEISPGDAGLFKDGSQGRRLDSVVIGKC